MKNLPSRVLAGAAAAALAALAVVALPLPASAVVATAVVADFTVEYDPAVPEAGATITGYSGSSTGVAIPSAVRVDSVWYTITAIGARAFYGAGLSSVSIPSNITSIGDEAFMMSNFTTVTIPASVTSIGAGAFAFNFLTSLTLREGLTSLGAHAFEGNRLASVTLPESLTSLSQNVFANNSITSITLPDTLTTIATGALANNDLTSITIPASVTTLGNDAFTMNPLDSVLMKGPVPTTLGDLVFDAGGGATPVVTYYARYPGYTQPTWTAGAQAYASRALVAAYFDAGLGGPLTVTEAWTGADIAAPTAPTALRTRFVGWSLTDGAGPVLEFPVTLGEDTPIFALWEDRAVTSPAKADAGDSFSMTGSGFEPGESVEVWLYSDPVLLTTLTASGTGTIGATLLIPSGTPAGLHQLALTGTTTGTTTYDLTVEVVLAASGSESGALALVALALTLAGAGLIASSHRVRVRARSQAPKTLRSAS